MAGNTKHVVNMANSIVGVSILSMPYCFKEAGLLLGVLLVLLSGVITKKTCMFLVRAAIMARRRSYEFLAFHVFGVSGKLFVEVCMILFLVGICISFHVVMGDLAPAIVARIFHLENTPSLRGTLLVGIAVLVVLPLCLLRKLDNLASMSACSILFYFFLITVIFWHAFPKLVDGSWYHMALLWRPAGALQVLPICMLGLSCQSNVFEIYDSVTDPDVPKMRSVVHQALNLCCALYISVGFFGYIAFVDQDMAGNLIMNFPATQLTEGIKVFFTVSLAISFPLMIFPCRTSIHSLLYRRSSQSYDLVGNYMPEARFKGITVGILAVSLVVGILIPNIEFVLGVLGSTMGVLISLVLPSIIFIKVNSKASAERLVAQGIMLMGGLLIVIGTYLNLSNIQHVQQVTAGQQKANLQKPVIPGPRDLVKEKPDLHLEELGQRMEAAINKVEAGGGAPVPGGDSVTRKEPVAPEPPPEKAPAPPPAPQDKTGEGKGKKEAAAGEDRGRADILHPDAIKKEEKEVHREGAAAAEAAGVEDKQEQLLQKIEVQQKEQQKILAEQKQILKELKDQKAQAQQELDLKRQEEENRLAAAAAAAAMAQQQQPAGGVMQQPVALVQQDVAGGVVQQPAAFVQQAGGGGGVLQLPAAANLPGQLVGAAPSAAVPAVGAPAHGGGVAVAAVNGAAPGVPALVHNAAVPNAAAPDADVSNVAAPNIAAPNAAALNVAAPNVAAPNAAVPNVAARNAAVPNIAAPNAAVPNVAARNAAVPNIAAPNAAAPNAAAPNVAVPNVAAPNVAVPNVAVLNVAVPNVAAPNAAEPNDAAPNAAAPNVVVPNVPNVAAPNVAVPNAAAPNVVAPNEVVPNADALNVGVPNAAPPNIAVPNAAVPDAAAPNVAVPDAAAPNVVAPNVAAPIVVVPNAAAPSAPGPVVGAPGAANAGVSAAMVPAVGAPDNAAQKAAVLTKKSPAAARVSSPAPHVIHLPHYPSAGKAAGKAGVGRKGPVGYLEKMASDSPAKAPRGSIAAGPVKAPHKKTQHDEERRKRSAGEEPPPYLPAPDLLEGGRGVPGLEEMAYDTRHLLWGARARRRRRRNDRVQEEEYWDET